ncbi:unnamed protein product, partial [Mesorhabditis spiculigera]
VTSSITSKIAPSLNTIVENFRHHVDHSTYGTAEGQLIAESTETNSSCGNDIGKEVAEEIGHDTSVVVISLPYTPSSLSANGGMFLMCHRKRHPRWVAIDKLKRKNTEWIAAQLLADQLETSENGGFYWRVRKGIAQMCIELTPNAVWMDHALASKDAWYVAGDTVAVKMELPEEGYHHEMPCEWPIRSLSATRDAVWAIRDDTGEMVVRVGMNNCRTGTDWVSLDIEIPGKLVAVKLVETVGFLLNEFGNLWMVKGVDGFHPYGNGDSFMSVCTPIAGRKGLPHPTQWRMTASTRGLFITAGRMLFASRVAVSGHRFPHVIPQKLRHYDKFTMLAAGALVDDSSTHGVFACRPNSELFGFRPALQTFATTTLPLANGQTSTVTSVAAIPERLIALDSCGALSERRLKGSDLEWKTVDTNGGTLLSAAVCEHGLWAVTSANEVVYMGNGDTQWHLVESPHKATLHEIRCSRDGRYVWVLSASEKRVWARSAVAELTPMGIKWVEASSEPHLLELAVGCNVVWGLANDGTLYRLRGLAANNPAGNYWRALPMRLRAISVDASNGLWGVDEQGSLVRHVTECACRSLPTRHTGWISAWHSGFEFI